MLLSELCAGESGHSEDSHMLPNAAVLSLFFEVFSGMSARKAGEKKQALKHTLWGLSEGLNSGAETRHYGEFWS